MNSSTSVDLGQFMGQFKNVVREHLQALPESEWERFRRRARAFEGDISGVDPSFMIDPDETPGQLLDCGASIDTISVADVMVPSNKKRAIKIGEIESAPVFYIDGRGVYVWAPDKHLGSLSFWATFPAYPEGW